MGIQGGGRQGSGWRQPGQGRLSPVPPPSPHQDALCTPTRRLLQDSQDIPVTVAPLRAERVLLFDDVLVLLQVGVGLTRGPEATAGVRGWLNKGWGRGRQVGASMGARGR